ncbi:MAG: MTAP family purine nucleoside phosphorylase [Deltaproteobacteria bacterium]|nr:MTAP family purine nucleoside phosphorylase [Deltaproteobacteria bacterium]
MGRLGIMTGSIVKDTKLFNQAKKKIIKNDHGTALVLITGDCAVIQRHGSDPNRYILPHLINHQANLTALKDLGVDEIIALQSTGSLRKTLKPGMLLVPDDFILPDGGPTIFSTEAVHITPIIDEDVRRKLIQAAQDCHIKVVNGGVYWQTKGPRLETRAEITMMARFAHLVGMTMAGEAVIARELGLPYASLCSIDNYAHGIGETELSQDDIAIHAKKNAEKAMAIVKKYIEKRSL